MNLNGGDDGPLDGSTDGQLLDRYYAGQGDALGELFRRLRPGLVSQALRRLPLWLTGRWHTAEDLASEVFFKVVRTGVRTDARWAAGEGTVTAWMGGMLRNEIASHVRRKPNRQRASTDMPVGNVDGEVGRCEDLVPDRQSAAPDRETDCERERRLSGAVDRLPKKKQKLLRMRFAERQKLAAMAERFGVSRATMSRWLQATLADVRREMGES